MEIKAYYVAIFSYSISDYVKKSDNMSLENCRLLIKNKRVNCIEDHGREREFVIMAVLDE